VLVKHSSSGYKDITPPEFSVRTTVHEYGGGAFTVDGDTIIFSNYKDQRLYLQSIHCGRYAHVMMYVESNARLIHDPF
jgi:hypothetical protein